MNREDIIAMAREAGLKVGANISGVVLVGSPAEIGLAHLTIEEIEHFAALVAAAEREACAKVADCISEDQWALYKGRPPYTGKELERASDYTQGKSDGAEVCAAAIRARSKP